MERILVMAIVVIVGANANNLPKSDKLDRVYTNKECKDLNLLLEVKRQELHNLIGLKIDEDVYEKMIRELLKYKKEYRKGCRDDS